MCVGPLLEEQFTSAVNRVGKLVQLFAIVCNHLWRKIENRWHGERVSNKAAFSFFDVERNSAEFEALFNLIRRSSGEVYEKSTHIRRSRDFDHLWF
jgi:hypothetical protein